MREWNWNPGAAKSGPEYEILTAEYCGLSKEVLVRRTQARRDLRGQWKYGFFGPDIEACCNVRVVAFRSNQVTGDDLSRAIAAYETIIKNETAEKAKEQ